MKFWQFPEQFQQNTAVITESVTLNYGQLKQHCHDFMAQLPDAGNLVILLCKNNLNTLVAWLACLNKQVPVLLLDANTPEETVADMVQRFSPASVVSEGVVVAPKLTNVKQPTVKADPRLAAMLSTSGSTGSAKQVALSYENLQANAESICVYLPICIDDVTITTLPFHYSYGLSVVNTHLMSGAAILLSEHSIMSREFWNLMSQQNITSLAGVPYTYEMLKRLGFLKKEFPALRYLTQAGGRLADELIGEFSDYMQRRQKRFYVMYGQTEATARMAWLKPESLPRKVGSIGTAIPGGKLFLVDEKKRPIELSNTQGELVYSGANIMLGYASKGEDLLSFNPELQLCTGDLAIRDNEGDYFITGRVARFVKIFGLRINLDEVETLLEQNGYHGKVTGTDKRLYLAISQNESEREVIQFLSKKIGLHPSVMRCTHVESYPLKSNQKIDYSALLALFEDGE